MNASSEPLIQLVDVDVPRADIISPVPIIRDVQWSVERGEFWAVGALPGNGKTDLIATAGGLQRPLKGLHLLFGKNIDEMDESEIVQNHLRVGIVFTDGRLFSELTVAENIGLALAYHHDSRRGAMNEKIEQALELTELSGLANRRPNQITRNLHQRVGLARALALNPEVLLIDNPLGGVDARQGRWWINFLCQLTAGHPSLQKKPLTIVTASDDLRPWLGTARQFAIIKDRSLQVLGGTEDVKSTDDPVVKELLMPPFTG